MNFLATDGNELYVTQKNNNIYDWKQFQSIYHKNYSTPLTETTISSNKKIIYDIYILPDIDSNRYGFQCLFSLGKESEYYPEEFYLERSQFILHWNSETNIIFITDGTDSTNTKLSFRIRDISTGERSENHKIFTGIDIVNKTLNTGILDSEKNILGIHPSQGTPKSYYIFKEDKSIKPVLTYDMILPENDNKLYLFTLRFSIYKDEQKTEYSYPPSFIQFTYANGKMENGRVGPLYKTIGPRYINENLFLKDEFNIEYIPHKIDPNQSYLRIKSKNYKISSISYNYLVI